MNKTGVIRIFSFHQMNKRHNHALFLTIPIKYNIFPVRRMMQGKAWYVARSAFQLAKIIANSETIDKSKSDNTRPFVKSLVDAVLTENAGNPQHTTKLVKGLTNQRFPGDQFYEAYISRTGHTKVKYEPHVLVDFRILNELSSLNEIYNHYGNNIEWTYSTLDARASTFEHKSQSNVDFWALLHNNTLGLGRKCVYHDDKTGKGLLEHTIHGSIGTLYFDNVGKNIPVTPNPIEAEEIILYNYRRISMLKQACLTDGNYAKYRDVLDRGFTLCQEMQNKDYFTIESLHDELQNLLWTELHSNPSMSRSLSFLFLKQIIETPLSDSEKRFSSTFYANLENRTYNLDKRSGFNDVFRAFILAARTEYPDFIDILHHLNKNGVAINPHVLQLISKGIKDGIF